MARAGGRGVRVMAIMRSVVGVMIVAWAAGACAASDDGGGCDVWWAARPSSDAWLGAVAACRRAPACPVVMSCDDPRWTVLADWALDEIAKCFDGPCEERAACVAAALPPAACWSEQQELETSGGQIRR